MIAAAIRLITGAQARWVGVEPVRPDGTLPQRIYFANHASNLDAPVIWASLPPAMRSVTRPVAARDYWDGGPVRRYLAQGVFNVVLVDRQRGPGAKRHPLAAVEEALEAGASLILFPEGTRTLDDEGEMNEFKPGLWHLARKFPAVELVPVHLENLNRILPKGDVLLVPLLAAVTFGKPVEFQEDRAEFLQRAKAAVEALTEGAGA